MIILKSSFVEDLAKKYVRAHQHAINKMPEDLFKQSENFMLTLAEHIIKQENLRRQTEVVSRVN